MAGKRFPVVETFGPVIQGEGALAGVPTHFVRFGLCDFRCSWCDSMYSVEPALVKQNADRIDADEIADRLDALSAGKLLPQWVTLSGGNPAIWDLTQLVSNLEQRGYSSAVETQGTIWQEWLGEVDLITVSPKAPSSGMAGKTLRKLPEFMQQVRMNASEAIIKIVAFDEIDFEWALGVFETYREFDSYLSVGTPPIGQWGNPGVNKAVTERQVRDQVGERYKWLCDKLVASEHPIASSVRVLPQLHVTAYGHARGV